MNQSSNTDKLNAISQVAEPDIAIEPVSQNDKHIRIVNTFMKRRTHMNKNAEMALTDPEFAHYLVNNSFGDGNLDGIEDLRVLFADSPNGSAAPLTLEIGFGLGDSFIEMAAAEPTRNFVGVEVHEPGIGKCAYMAGTQELNNVKIINGDAIQLITRKPYRPHPALLS